MAEISKITLPSGNTYDIKDAVAREAIAGGVSFVVAWNGASTPTPANIPEGVVVTYNSTDYTGTLDADQAQVGAFYLVYNSNTANNSYSEYVPVGTTGSKTWEKLGDTTIDLSDLSLSKGSGDMVLGEATTFTNASSSVTFSGGSTDTFVKSYPGTTSKLVTTSIPNVTGNTSVTANKSTWTFTMGTGTDAETLIIGGGNGSDVTATNTTLGTAITAATGALDGSASGASVMTGLGTATTASAVTGVGTGTAAAQTITVGTNDKVKIAKYDDLAITTT